MRHVCAVSKSGELSPPMDQAETGDSKSSVADWLATTSKFIRFCAVNGVDTPLPAKVSVRSTACRPDALEAIAMAICAVAVVRCAVVAKVSVLPLGKVTAEFDD